MSNEQNCQGCENNENSRQNLNFSKEIANMNKNKKESQNK